jgi:hypothetical protein
MCKDPLLRRLLFRVALCGALLFVANDSAAQLPPPPAVAYSPDLVVNDTPACVSHGKCNAGRTMTATDPNNPGSYAGIFWSNCSVPTIVWLKGGGPAGPWGVETHRVGTGYYGYIDALDEKSVSSNTVTFTRQFYNANTLSFGSPRIPLWVTTWSGWYDVPTTYEVSYNACPSGQGQWSGPSGYPRVIDTLYLAGDGMNPFRVRDCRPGGNCSTEYPIDILWHTEPTCCTPGEEYIFGRWTDPQTGVVRGLGFIAWRPTPFQPWETTTLYVVNGDSADPCPTCP